MQGEGKLVERVVRLSRGERRMEYSTSKYEGGFRDNKMEDEGALGKGGFRSGAVGVTGVQMEVSNCFPSILPFSPSMLAAGMYEYPDGSKYVGSMKDGAFHGAGKLYFDGGVFIGVWKKGKTVKGGKRC